MSGSTQVWRRCGGRLNRHGDSHSPAAVPSGKPTCGCKGVHKKHTVWGFSDTCLQLPHLLEARMCQLVWGKHAHTHTNIYRGVWKYWRMTHIYIVLSPFQHIWFEMKDLIFKGVHPYWVSNTWPPILKTTHQDNDSRYTNKPIMEFLGPNSWMFLTGRVRRLTSIQMSKYFTCWTPD